MESQWLREESEVTPWGVDFGWSCTGPVLPAAEPVLSAVESIPGNGEILSTPFPVKGCAGLGAMALVVIDIVGVL